jgi:nicotinamide-nucleotide amidase
MKAIIITIGDELLIGQVINTNQAFIAQRLNRAGVAVDRMLTVGDEMAAMLAAFREGWSTHEVVVVTGGLGPTHDDVTKKAVCAFFDTPLEARPELRRHIEQLLGKRGISWKPSHEEQTLFPAKAAVVPNPLGTAAGMHFQEPGRHFFVLPGVPYEMEEMLDTTIAPFLASRVEGSVIRHRTLRSTGATESFLAAAIGDVDAFLKGATLAFLPSPTGVRLRISVREASPASADRNVAAIEGVIRARVGGYIYGVDDEEIQAVLGALLRDRHLTLATAESCTGGLIASRITDSPGSSDYFERGVVAYSNRSKTELLGVPAELLAREGAVSEPVAVAMAEGIRHASGAGIGLSTTGIAGPSGGSEGRPVGLVWIGYADASASFARRFLFGDQRLRVKERASQAALEIAWRQAAGR